MQTFPSLIKHNGIIRIKVAAICTCLDTLIYRNEEDEEEIKPFVAQVERRYYDRLTQKEYSSISAVEPHAFVYLNPTGYLAEYFNFILSLLKQSITNHDLRAVSIKIDIEKEEINAEETWIRTKDFYKWCQSRDLEFGDICAQYEDAEEDIVCHIDDAVSDIRRNFEAPLFDATYAKRLKLPSFEEEIIRKDHDSLLRENILLRMGFDPEIIHDNENFSANNNSNDKPLRTTERNALLSIIAILCDKDGYDTDRAAKTATAIKNRADLAGIDIGETTIENHLKKIPDAITRRLRR